MAAILSQPQCVNLFWPSDVIWRNRSGSTLAQVMTFVKFHIQQKISCLHNVLYSEVKM